MSRRLRLEDGEALVISVTPVPRGLLMPALLLVVLEGAVVWLGMHWHLLHRYEPVVLLGVGVLPALVLATRSWRWRSHRIIVTNQRIVTEGGVLSRYSTQVNLGDVISTRADQTLVERLRRRGLVSLETSSGMAVLGPVRHPMALRRLVDRSRRDLIKPVAQSWDEWFEESPDDDRRGRPR